MDVWDHLAFVLALYKLGGLGALHSRRAALSVLELHRVDQHAVVLLEGQRHLAHSESGLGLLEEGHLDRGAPLLEAHRNNGGGFAEGDEGVEELGVRLLAVQTVRAQHQVSLAHLGCGRAVAPCQGLDGSTGEEVSGEIEAHVGLELGQHVLEVCDAHLCAKDRSRHPQCPRPAPHLHNLVLGRDEFGEGAGGVCEEIAQYQRALEQTASFA
mmetsp:Transcript_39744/g.94210  ORF Transcript_39744/g.94210 Transcript_39744/m.94210 type:complete len:212 (-) Transcript_39744:391-1026(-)